MMKKCLPLLLFAIVAMSGAAAAQGDEFIAAPELKRMELQRFWGLRLPLEPGECVARLAQVDDTIYAMTNGNRALSIHAPTGVIRWSNFVGEPGQTVRGPSHASKYVLFTVAGAAHLFDRQTGELATSPRVLRGVIIDVSGENATISIGEDHGVVIGDTLNVYRSDGFGGHEGSPIARLKVETVQRRSSRGHLERVADQVAPKPGFRVEADVMLPIQEVKLPFAASSAAISDNKFIYFGGANERFYAIDMVSGVEQWALGTPGTVTATPVIFKDTLYIAGQDGQVISCTKQEKAKNWTFNTEAPIFADLVVTPKRVFAASTDRSLYALDRLSGKRLWRERFDKPLSVAPTVTGNHVYQLVDEEGLYVIDAESGKRLWHRPEGGEFLIEIGDDAYLLATDESPRLMRVNAKDGHKKDEVDAFGVSFALANQMDQSIFLGDVGGVLTCLRPAGAPRLKPAQLQEALRNDHKTELASEIKIKAPERKLPAPTKSIFENDEGLASRSTARPVGGHGFPGEKPGEVKKTGPAPAKAEDGQEGEKPEATEGGEAAKEGEAKEGEAKEEKSAEEGGEEKPEEQGAEGEEKPDASKATSQKADEDEDADEKGEGEKKPDDEGGG